MSTVMEGMAFGTGSAIAHRAVGAVFGSMGGGAPAAPAESTAQAATAPVSAKTIADKCAPYQQEVRRFCRRSNAYVSLGNSHRAPSCLTLSHAVRRVHFLQQNGPVRVPNVF